MEAYTPHVSIIPHLVMVVHTMWEIDFSKSSETDICSWKTFEKQRLVLLPRLVVSV